LERLLGVLEAADAQEGDTEPVLEVGLARIELGGGDELLERLVAHVSPLERQPVIVVNPRVCRLAGGGVAEGAERRAVVAALVVERAEVRVGLGEVARKALGLAIDLERLLLLAGGEVGGAEEEVGTRVVAVRRQRPLVEADRGLEIALLPVEVAEELQRLQVLRVL